MKNRMIWLTVVMAGFAAITVSAQDAPKSSTPEATPERYYRLNLVLEEINDAGKVTNTRSFVETVMTGRGGPNGQIRTGSRIPIQTGAHDGSTQFQYIDLGVNFDVRQVKEIGDKLAFFLSAEVSSLADNNAGGASANLRGDPVIRQNKWDSSVLIPVGKPAVVYSADDLDSKGKMQVEVTATRVD